MPTAPDGRSFNASRWVVAGLGLVAAAMLALMGSASTTARAAVTGSEAGMVWHYKADVDGSRPADRVVIRGTHNLKVSDGAGTGRYFVTIRFDGFVRTVGLTHKAVDYYSPRSPWTPYYGAADLDGDGAREVLTGASTGAHSQGFFALRAHRNRLYPLPPPGGSRSRPVWAVNGSYGTGDEGWKCTSSGVQSRAIYPKGSIAHGIKRYTETRSSYVRRSGAWQRIFHEKHVVRARHNGEPPRRYNGYGGFECQGLPKPY